MAEDNVVFNLKVNTDQAVSGIKSAHTALEEFDSEIIQVTKDTNELKQTNIEFKKELLQLEETARRLPAGWAGDMKRADLKTKIDDLKGAIKDNNLALQDFRLKKNQVSTMRADFKDLASHADAFEESLHVGEAGLGGYEAFVGLTAMAGVENENLLKSLHNLEAAESALSGVQKVREAIAKDGILREKLSNIQLKLKVASTKAQVIAQKAFNGATGKGTKATKLFGKALIATGIGAIVLLLGLIIANFDKISKSVGKFVDSIPFLQSIKDTFSEIGEAIGSVGNLMSSVGASLRAFFRGEDVTDAFNAALEEGKKLIAAEERLVEVTGTQAKNRERQIQLLEAQGGKEKEIATLKKKQVKDEIKAMEAILALNGELTEEQLSRLDDLKTNLQVIYIEQDKAAKKEIEDRAKARKEANEKWRKEKKKADAAAAKEEARLAKLKLEEQRTLEDLILANIKDADLRKMGQLELQHKRELDALRKKYGEESEIVKQAKTKQAGEVSALNEEIQNGIDEKAAEDLEKKNENDKLALENKLTAAGEDFMLQQEIKAEQLQLEREQLAANTTITDEQRLEQQLAFDARENANAKASADYKIAQEKALKDAKVAAAQSTLNAVSAFGKLAIKDGKKQEAFQKKIALVQLGIDTAKAISSTIAGATAAAASTGPAAPFVLAGYIAGGLATVFANIAQAKKLLGGGGPSLPSSGGGGGDIGGVSAEAISGDVGAGTGRGGTTGGGKTNVEDIIGNEGGDKTIKVAVLESDITNTQDRISQVEALSTI